MSRASIFTSLYVNPTIAIFILFAYAKTFMAIVVLVVLSLFLYLRFLYVLYISMGLRPNQNDIFTAFDSCHTMHVVILKAIP